MNFTINFKLLESLWRLHEKSLVSISEVGIEEILQKLCLCINSHFLWLCNRTPSSPIARESLKRAKSSDWLQAVLLLHFLLYLCIPAELLQRSAYKYGIETQHPLERSRFANQSEKNAIYFFKDEITVCWSQVELRTKLSGKILINVPINTDTVT